MANASPSKIKANQPKVFGSTTNINKNLSSSLVRKSDNIDSVVKSQIPEAGRKSQAPRGEMPKVVEHVAAPTAPQSDPENEVVVPSGTISLWFDPVNYEDEIKDIEKESLPEFFSQKYPSKTPVVYKEYRNFMIALYRMNPTVYLSATTVRRHLCGDVNGIIRIHAFLEKWGLINFSCNPRYKPHKMSLLKETSYDKVLINAANKNSLHKSVNEFKNNLYLRTVDEKNEERLERAIPDSTLMKLLNIATLNYRPICSFGESKVGFKWYETSDNE